MSTTTIPATLTTQAADKGGRIVFTLGQVNLVGLEGSNPERRVVRITRALNKGGVDVANAKVRILKTVPKRSHNVRGMTAREIATEIWGADVN
jgi:hypothetical protein